MLDIECRSQSFAPIMAIAVSVHVLIYVYLFIAQIHLAFGILCNTYIYLNWHRAFFDLFSRELFVHHYSMRSCSIHPRLCVCEFVNAFAKYAQASRMCLCTVNISLHSYSHSLSMQVCIVNLVNKHKH